MMKREHKLVLGILNAFGGNLSRKSIQKLVFLFCERVGSPFFSFVPFKYGCYSEELAVLQYDFSKRGLLNKNTEDWVISAKGKKSVIDLDLIDTQNISDLKRRFGRLSETEIIKYVYLTYPYYAINSIIMDKVLSPEEQKPILRLKRKMGNTLAGKKIVSVGYEGYSIDRYVQMLLDNGVKVLCDVRKNPISRKRGFSKSAFSRALEEVHIKYYHISELGIPSNMRQELDSQEDYDRLFDYYERNILSYNLKYVEKISSLLDNFGTTALLCFEKDPRQCHRTRIVKRLLEYRENDLKVVTSCP